MRLSIGTLRRGVKRALKMLLPDGRAARCGSHSPPARAGAAGGARRPSPPVRHDHQRAPSAVSPRP